MEGDSVPIKKSSFIATSSHSPTAAGVSVQGVQLVDSATSSFRKKRLAPIIIRSKKESYGYDIIRENNSTDANFTWGSLAFSVRNRRKQHEHLRNPNVLFCDLFITP